MWKSEALEIITAIYNNHKGQDNDDPLLLPMLEYCICVLNNENVQSNTELNNKILESKTNMEKWAMEEKRQMLEMGFLSASNNSPKEKMASAFGMVLKCLS